MSAIFRVLFRLIAIVAGFVFACLVLSGAAHILIYVGLAPFILPKIREILSITSFLTVPVLAAWIAWQVAIPAGALIALAEYKAARDWLPHTLGGAAALGLAALSLAIDPAQMAADSGLAAFVIAAGFVGGWCYWLVAGRGSGAWRAPVIDSTSSES